MPTSGSASTPNAHLEPLSSPHLYQQLLRLVYRFLFLLVSEGRGLISTAWLYREQYGILRLWRLVDNRDAYTHHEDLRHSLRVLQKILASEKLAPLLYAAPLDGRLFAPIDLDNYLLSNYHLLRAFWYLVYYRENPKAPPRRVNYNALDVEELGSVYESLLDYHPRIDFSGGVSRFAPTSGSERKGTGPYYTPTSLVEELLRSALDPVI